MLLFALASGPLYSIMVLEYMEVLGMAWGRQEESGRNHRFLGPR